MAAHGSARSELMVCSTVDERRAPSSELTPMTALASGRKTSFAVSVVGRIGTDAASVKAEASRSSRG